MGANVEVVEEAREANHPGFDVVDRYQNRLIAYANSITGDGESARDVVQETFLRFFANARIEEARRAAWLFHVCRNLSIDVLRSRRRLTPIERHSELGSEGGAECVEAKKDSSTIMGLVARLPKTQAEVLRLKFHCDLSYREISEITSLPVSNVGLLIHRGIKAIREQLEPRVNVVEMRR